MKCFELGPEIFYLLGGVVSAFFMAIASSFCYTKKSFATRIAAAFMCAMLTCSVAISLHAFWELSYIWTVIIGTVTGFLGTDFIRGVITAVVKAYITTRTGVVPDVTLSQRVAVETVNGGGNGNGDKDRLKRGSENSVPDKAD